MILEEKIHSCPELIDYINRIGFLPLLNSKEFNGWSAEAIVDEDCQYIALPNGGWEWPLWKWKGSVLRESGCAYGKFYNNKAGFVSREWWIDFCNYRRSIYPYPIQDSIEDMILQTLSENGRMITRDLRVACGFTGSKMRSKFDGLITFLEMSCRIIIEDFVYPHDKNGQEYGWGWALLTTPEFLFGKEFCHTNCSPKKSYNKIDKHLQSFLPEVSDKMRRTFLK